MQYLGQKAAGIYKHFLLPKLKDDLEAGKLDTLVECNVNCLFTVKELPSFLAQCISKDSVQKLPLTLQHKEVENMVLLKMVKFQQPKSLN